MLGYAQTLNQKFHKQKNQHNRKLVRIYRLNNFGLVMRYVSNAQPFIRNKYYFVTENLA